MEEFVSDEEYPSYYRSLNGLRSRVVRDLPIAPDMRVLDVPTGSGYFAVEVAGRDPSLNVVGIDIAETDIVRARDEIKAAGLGDRVSIAKMDATELGFRPASFDLATCFLGLEDIHMTRGRDSVRETFAEVGRVLRPGGRFCPAVMPPEEMETEAQKLEVAVFDYICGAKWLGVDEYEELLGQAGFGLIGRQAYRTGKKLTLDQAREEIEYACESVSKVYGVESRSFEDVWAKYGGGVEAHGLGHYSKIVVLTAEKLR